MIEIQNNFLSAVDINSEKQENITENEWVKINKDKDKLLSEISNTKIKNQFELKYQSLDSYFKQDGEQVYKTTKSDFSFLKEAFQSSISSNETIKNKLISKYSTEYKGLQSDVITFINSSFNNSLQNELGDFNMEKFDKKDGNKGFSEYELEQYSQVLDKAMNQMNILGSYKDFKKQYQEINEDPSFMSWKGDVALANKIDLQEHIFGEGKKHITDNFHYYNEEDLTNMRNEEFDITDSKKMGNFLTLLGLELGDGIEDILRFIGNIPSGLILLPRYINNRLELTDSSVNTKDEVEAQMENDMLLEGNPSLMLCELLGEKGIQMIKQLGEMFVSGKNGDITLLIVTIAGLLAGGAGAVKILAKAGKMEKTAKIAGKIQNKANKVDDIVGGAGIGHMTGGFSSDLEKIDSFLLKDKTKINSEILLKAKKVLGDKPLSIQQNKSIIKAYNIGLIDNKVISNYTDSEIRQKIKILKKGGFNIKERRFLLEKGICGKVSENKIYQFNVEGKNLSDSIDNIYELAEKTKLDYNKLLIKIGEETGSTEILDSTKVALKGKGGTLTKVETDYKGDLSKMRDILRGSIVYDDIGKLKKGIDKFKYNSNIEEVYIDNRLENIYTNDILLHVRFKNGFIGEVQLHIKETLIAKEIGYLLNSNIVNLDKLWKESDYKILAQLKSKEWGGRELLKSIGLPKSGDLVIGHDLYEIQRSFEKVDLNHTQREFLSRVKGLQRDLNTYARELYTERTGKTFN